MLGPTTRPGRVRERGASVPPHAYGEVDLERHHLVRVDRHFRTTRILASFRASNGCDEPPRGVDVRGRDGTSRSDNTPSCSGADYALEVAEEHQSGEAWNGDAPAHGGYR
jgi:hypothetical protein